MLLLILSEPVGAMAGAMAGRLGARIGRKLAPERGWSRYVCVGLAVCATHYAAGVFTKTLLSAGALDLPGAVVGATVTTPLAAAAHGVIEGVWEALA